MRDIFLKKAQSFVQDQEVESTVVRFVEPLVLPEGFTIQDARGIFLREAELLADALCTTLPQGTVDALLVCLLERKRSTLIIPMGG